MTNNPLFYATIVPLNRDAHRGLHMPASEARFGFAAASHIVPAVVDEFVAGGRHLPIVFIPCAGAPSAVFLLGLRPGENRFVAADGRWSGDYVPAYLRRYPFIIGEVADAQPLVCLDESYAGLRDAIGERLFLESGEESPALKGAVQLMNEYMVAAKRNDVFVALLQKLDLFQVVTIDVRTAGQETRTLHGAMMINAAKLAALNDDDFLQLRQQGYLPGIYAHLSSLAGIDRLRPPEAIPVTPRTADAASGKSTDVREPA